ncbi:MAG: thioesterase family protein, partial [Gammaproteobacteria bacterium]|nr:thioesterase family protein [Gammaproteobacteria bacterium]
VVPTPRIRRVLASRKAFRVKPVCPEHFLVSQPFAPVKRVWMKAVDSLPDAPLLHDVLLAYVSDYDLISTATLPHGLHASFGGLQMASLDHAMWFHRPARMDQWLLFDLESPNASGGRGMALGRVFSEDGVLVASVAQEGLIRLRRPGA